MGAPEQEARRARGRLGVLGGTFDPVHLGHIASATEIAAAFELDPLLLVLSARPPHKCGREPAPVEDRLAMLRLAAAGERRLVVSDIEVRRAGLSYTCDTLAELGRSWPSHDLYLVLGIDAYLDMDTWHRPESILELANLVVTTRPGHDFPQPASPPSIGALGPTCYDPCIGCYVHTSGHVIVGHAIRGLEVSASEIRDHLAAGRPVEELTGAAVARYIGERSLYGVRPR